jgi:hypothetical protein
MRRRAGVSIGFSSTATRTRRGCRSGTAGRPLIWRECKLSKRRYRILTLRVRCRHIKGNSSLISGSVLTAKANLASASRHSGKQFSSIWMVEYLRF